MYFTAPVKAVFIIMVKSERKNLTVIDEWLPINFKHYKS